jgi:hypothetical protein
MTIFSQRFTGIQSFARIAKLSDVKIVGSGDDGGNQFINVPLTTTLNNPSNVSLHTTTTSLTVIFKDTPVGVALIEVRMRDA